MLSHSDREQKITELKGIIEPLLSDSGYELVEIQLMGSGKRAILRVFMDSEDGITVDDCAKMSEEISVHLDVEDPIQRSYVLEVSSPGLDRPLTQERHYRRSIGRKVHVIMNANCIGKKEFLGRLVDYNDHVLMLKNSNGKMCEIPTSDIRQAKIRL
jgi:ribosome maturation factor RimP